MQHSTHTQPTRDHLKCGIDVTAAIAEGKRPATFRTRKLSPPAPMVLHPRECGRVGRRRTILPSGASDSRVPLRRFRGTPLSVLDPGPERAQQGGRLVEGTAGEETDRETAPVGPAADDHGTAVAGTRTAAHDATERTGRYVLNSGDRPTRVVEQGERL